MVRLKLNLLQCFMCLLLLWLGIVDSFPSTELSHRYERDTSETVFATGELDLVLQNDDFQFEICCKKDANDPDICYLGELRFCFPTTRQIQRGNGLFECGAKTCSYRIKYYSNNGYELGASSFTTSEECFKGKINNEHIYAIYTNGEPAGEKTNDGCPLDLQPGNRLKIDVKEIPKGVTVKVLNAQKYVEPTTTTLPPSTAPPTTEPLTTEKTNATDPSKKEPSATPATKEETGMSDALKFSLIGVGIFVFILIAGGIAFAVYWFCYKKKKSPKPAPPDTVPKAAAADTTPVTKETPIVKDKTKESKPENETKGVLRSNHASTNGLESEHWVSVNPQLPAAAFASEGNTKTDASKIQADDETGQNGKSKSKKSENKEVSTKK